MSRGPLPGTAWALLVLVAVVSPLLRGEARAQEAPLRCVAFSPYGEGYDPELGPHPPPQVIGALLDLARATSGLNCIQTYGVLNGLDHIFNAAAARNMKAIAIIWLDASPDANNASTAFEGIREPWKVRREGPVGPYWGLFGGGPRAPENLRVVQ